jgi:hypothetical protein
MHIKPLPEMYGRFRFSARLNYSCIWEHDCWDNAPGGGYFKLFVGSNAGLEHLRETYNGTPAQFQRDVVQRLDTIVADHNMPVSRELLAGFNRWRFQVHEERVERILSQPDRYGITDRNDPFLRGPSIVVPAVYQLGVGWVRDGSVEDAKAEAGL